VRVVFLGPPGAGKGTQAARLTSKRGIPHISTGEILRTAIQRQTPTGLEAQGYMDKGEFVPFEIVLRLVRDRLQEADAAEGWLLDGFPRNLEQGSAFEQLLAEMGQALDHAIFFDVADEEVVRRLGGRRVCETCGDTFHLEFSPPPAEGTCGKGDCRIIQRSDDSEEAIRNRLRVYSEETDPLVEHYRSSGSLQTIDASGAIEGIESEVDRICGSGP